MIDPTERNTVYLVSETHPMCSTGRHTEYQCDTPRDLSRRLSKFIGKLFDGERDGEKVECIPAPGKKSDEEEQPLL